MSLFVEEFSESIGLEIGFNPLKFVLDPRHNRLFYADTLQQEIPLPSAPIAHALFQTYLCCALLSSETSQTVNCVIDLSDASLTEVLPVSQVPPLEDEDGEGKEAVNANIVVIPDEKEFLVTSYTGTSTMGVFLNGQGDPVRGTIPWTSHPLSISKSTRFMILLYY